MNYFLQEVPSMVQLAYSPTEKPFETKDDLLGMKEVKSFEQLKGFSFFAMSDKMLIAVSDGGYSWWPVGQIADPSSLDFPEWDGGKYRIEVDGNEIEVNGSEVLSSCAGTIILRDGREGRRVDIRVFPDDFLYK